MRSPDWGGWPDLRVVVRLFPWHWAIKPHTHVDAIDGIRGYCHACWLMVEIEWWGPERA